MKKLIIILFLGSICYGTPFVILAKGDEYTSHQLPYTDSSLDIGSADLFWRYIYGDAFTDGTALWDGSALTGFTSITSDIFTDGTAYWESNELYGFDEIDADSIVAHVDLYGETITGIDILGTTITGTTLTDGTFTTTAGVVEATTFNNLIFRALDDYNICIGDGAGATGQTGDNNIFIGLDAGSSTTSGSSNTFVGYISGASLTTGGFNVGIGSFSLGGSLDTGEKNTSIGYASGLNATGDNNIFIGYNTGLFETGSDTLLIDDRLRANEATGRARALLYGIMADAVADQSLRINGDFTVLGDDVWFQPLTDSTQYFSIFDADAGAPIFEVDATNEKVAIGAHPGGIGYAKLMLYGPQSNAVGPHMEFMTDEDAYPTMQILNWGHDLPGIAFDAYFDGSHRSSDLGSNARIHKASDYLSFLYDSGVAQGGVLTWNYGMVMDLTDGDVGIGTTSPDSTLQVVGDTHLGADTTDYTSFSGLGTMTLHGDARVKRHIVIGAASWKLGATAPTQTYENIFPTLSFNTGQDDEAHYTTWVPFRWDDTTDMEVHVHWQMADDTDDGSVFWKLKYIGVEPGEDPAGGGTEITQLSAGNHPQDEIIDTVFTTKILAANIAREDDLGLMLWRHGTDGSDDCGEDAELIAMHIHFTINQLGESFETFYLLLETGDFLLLETGDKLILEGV